MTLFKDIKDKNKWTGRQSRKYVNSFPNDSVSYMPFQLKPNMVVFHRNGHTHPKIQIKE